MKKEKKQEERYHITFKGLLSVYINDLGLVTEVMDGLELHMRRHHMQNGECGAIIYTGKEWVITSVKQEEK